MQVTHLFAVAHSAPPAIVSVCPRLSVLSALRVPRVCLYVCRFVCRCASRAVISLCFCRSVSRGSGLHRPSHFLPAGRFSGLQSVSSAVVWIQDRAKSHSPVRQRNSLSIVKPLLFNLQFISFHLNNIYSILLWYVIYMIELTMTMFYVW